MPEPAFPSGRLAVTHRWRSPDGTWCSGAGTTDAWPLLGGGVHVSEVRSDGGLHGVSLKVRDAATGRWSIWWVDAATGRLGPPVTGSWAGGHGRFAGVDDDGALVAYDIDGDDDVTRWEQSRSVDGGRTWAVERTMEVRRVADAPPEHGGERQRDDQASTPAGDFAFLARPLAVDHRHRARGGGEGWTTFRSAHRGRSLLGGAVSVDEVGLDPAPRAGLTFRARDTATGRWSIWWVASDRGRLEPPVHGGFEDGVGTFVGAEPDQLVRFTWSGVDGDRPHWLQELSADGGRTWLRDWEMAFSPVDEGPSPPSPGPLR